MGETPYTLATFECDTGYTMKGKTNTHCLDGGNWADFNTSCNIIGKILNSLNVVKRVILPSFAKAVASAKIPLSAIYVSQCVSL